MAKLALISHGECIWHSKSVFTGWHDVPLSSEGIIDALRAGTKVADINPDIIVASMKIRAIETAMIAITQCERNKTPILIRDDEKMENWINTNNKAMEKTIIPIFRTQSLNEQCELQDNGDINIREYNENPVYPWCYNYDKPLQNDECMRDTAKRGIPFFERNIVPQLKKGKNIMISAHSNSLYPIAMFIENIMKEKPSGIQILPGKPLLYEYNNGIIKKINN